MRNALCISGETRKKLGKNVEVTSITIWASLRLGLVMVVLDLIFVKFRDRDHFAGRTGSKDWRQWMTELALETYTQKDP